MQEPIKVLVVDDSAFMRKSISIMLEEDPGIKVISTARDGLEGLELTKKLRPDLVTLDIEMPKMDGLTTLENIMKDCPTPVIMVSSLTTEGAEATIKALELGAVDFIPKELSFINVNIIKIREELIRKVKEIVSQRSVRRRFANVRPSSTLQKEVSYTSKYQSLPKIGYRAVALGISTGGPLSLQKVIPFLTFKNVPMFIVQHMPPKFTKSLAQRLNDLSPLTVKEAEEGEVVKNGTIYIAPGGYHMTLKKQPGFISIKISEQPADTLHKPSVDVMMNSVIDIYGKHTLGVMMTGMGKDGSIAFDRLKKLGGYTIAQDQESCVVFGMPRAVIEEGNADVIADLEKIPFKINEAL